MPISEMNFNPDSDIAMWGPTGSGKTWLIQAFAKELQWFDKNDDHFGYELLDEDQQPVEAAPPTPIGTREAEDHLLYFRRVPRIQDRAHNYSAHTHMLNIHDDAGSSLVAGLVDPKAFADAHQTLINSRYTLVVLDPTYARKGVKSTLRKGDGRQDTPYEDDLEDLDDDDNGELPYIARKDYLTPQEYLQLIQALFRELSVGLGNRQNARKKRYLAICLTKMDRKKLHGDPNLLLGRLFGEDMKRLVESYRSTFAIRVFSTSAAGMIGVGNQKRSMESDGGLENPGLWDPRGTTAPFFWMFQNAEMERLGVSTERLKWYLPYPVRS